MRAFVVCFFLFLLFLLITAPFWAPYLLILFLI